MSLRDVVQNAASPTFAILACTVIITLFACYRMSRGSLSTSHTKLVFRLFLELTLLAIVSFIAAVIVLSVFHARFEQYSRQLSDLETVIERKLTGPLDFVKTRAE